MVWMTFQYQLKTGGKRSKMYVVCWWDLIIYKSGRICSGKCSLSNSVISNDSFQIKNASRQYELNLNN